MLTTIKRVILITTFLSLILTNILTLTSMAFNAALSGLMASRLGISTVTSKMQKQIDSKSIPLKKQAATRRFGSRLASRTKRVAAKSIAAIPAESIPFLGVAVLIADTGYELYAACETLRDLDVLYADLGMPDETPDDAIHSACNPSLPSAGNVWAGVVAKSGEWLGQAREAMR